MTNEERSRSQAVSQVFKALGHPSRAFIVEKLRESEHCVCELSEMIGADMSTVYYSLACDCLGGMLSGVESILHMQLDSQSAVVSSLSR